jgi:hypothetical protein
VSHDSSIAIVSIEDVAAALEVTDSSANDELALIVDGVSGAVEEYLGRPVLARSVTESIDGNGESYIMLKPYLQSVTTVVVDDITITASTERVFYPKTGKVQLLYTTFSKGFQNVDLVYKHGWDAGDIPAAIRRATVKWCCHEWLMTKKDRLGVLSKSTNDGSSVSYDLTADIPASVGAMLDPWRIASFG